MGKSTLRAFLCGKTALLPSGPYKTAKSSGLEKRELRVESFGALGGVWQVGQSFIAGRLQTKLESGGPAPKLGAQVPGAMSILTPGSLPAGPQLWALTLVILLSTRRYLLGKA